MSDQPTVQTIEEALAYHQGGDLSRAIAAYQRLIELDPKDARSLNGLAIALIQSSGASEAVEFAKRAVASQPDSADYLDTLAHALEEVQKNEEAIAAWRAAVGLNPAHLKAHLSLGNALWEMGAYEEAIAVNQRALELDPRSVAGLNNLGNALRAQGRFDEAIAAYRRALLAAGGLNLMDDEKLRPAKRGQRQTLGDVGMAKVPMDLAGEFAITCYNLGECHSTAAKFEEAVPCYRTALQADPKFLKAHVGLTVALVNLQDIKGAMASWQKAAALAPEAALTFEALGEIQLHSQKAVEAVESYRRAVKADPQSPTAWGRLARGLESLGNFEESDKCTKRRQELEIRPSQIDTSSSQAEPPSDRGTELESLLEKSKQSGLALENRISIHFKLGQILDESERYDEAFHHFAVGNSLARRQREMAGEGYDHESFSRGVDQMIRTFTADFFAERREWGNPSEVPVFIVGMPRSGTTLVHQIAASHSQVYGAGELTLAQQIEIEFGGDAERLSVAQWNREKVRKMADAHLSRLRGMSESALRIVDKLPGNVNRVAQLAATFPRSRVIICRRDPRDTCLSCYFQCFSNGLDFSLDLGDCGRRQVETDRLAAHWINVRPMAIMEMEYETLVNDLEGQSRRLIEFLGLPWEPACLEFYRAQTAVLTASIRQVRKPIYQKSVGRWKHYEKHLGPLFEALGGQYAKAK